MFRQIMKTIPFRPSQPFERERISPRHQTRVLVSLKGQSRTIETVGNVGIGGFCVAWNERLKLGQQIDLLIDLVGMGHWVIATGQVLENLQQGRQLAIRGHFLAIDFEQERQLARWLDQQERQNQVHSISRCITADQVA